MGHHTAPHRTTSRAHTQRTIFMMDPLQLQLYPQQQMIQQQVVVVGPPPPPPVQVSLSCTQFNLVTQAARIHLLSLAFCLNGATLMYTQLLQLSFQNPLPIASHLQLQQMALQNEQLQNEQLIERQVAGHNSHVQQQPRIVHVVQVVQVVGHPPPPSQHNHQYQPQHQHQHTLQNLHQHQPQQEQQPYGGQVQSVKVVNDGKTCECQPFRAFCFCSCSCCFRSN